MYVCVCMYMHVYVCICMCMYVCTHSENGHKVPLHTTINYRVNEVQLEFDSKLYCPLVPKLHHMDKDLHPISYLSRE